MRLQPCYLSIVSSVSHMDLSIRSLPTTSLESRLFTAVGPTLCSAHSPSNVSLSPILQEHPGLNPTQPQKCYATSSSSALPQNITFRRNVGGAAGESGRREEAVRWERVECCGWWGRCCRPPAWSYPTQVSHTPRPRGTLHAAGARSARTLAQELAEEGLRREQRDGDEGREEDGGEEGEGEGGESGAEEGQEERMLQGPATVPAQERKRQEYSDVDYLAVSDSELLRQCQVDTYRASGPGGQHRNKTESAVRLRHTPTGCVSQSAEQRSQHLNRDTALLRLRQAIALRVRRRVDPAQYSPSTALLRILPPAALKGRRLPLGVQSVGPRHPQFHPGVRELLDVLCAVSCSVSEAAVLFGVSTAALSKLLTSDKALLQQVNVMRALHCRE